MITADAEERPPKIRRLNSTGSGQDYRYSVDPAEVGSDDRNNSQEIDNNVPEDPNLSFHEREQKPLLFDPEARVRDLDQSQSLSKSQLKKLRKKQEWEAGRDYRKQKRKEKEKEKKARKAEERAAKAQEDIEKMVQPIDQARMNHHRPVQMPITFVLDCDFDDLMTDGEIVSLSSQLTRCYSDNKSAPFRANIVVSSFGGKLKHRFETVLASNHSAWKGVTFTEGDFVTAARDFDGIMRNQQVGRTAGALAKSANLSADSSNITSHKIEKFRTSAEPAIHESTADASEGTFEIHRNGLPLAIFTDATSLPDGTLTQASSKPESREFKDVDPTTEENPLHISTPQANSEVEISLTSIEAHSANTMSPYPEKILTHSQTPSIIYLSSDSPNVLDVLSPYTTYIIGGLVDKNRHKGLCYKRACERGIPTAKLPIGEYMIIQSRTVLATNHVVEIMLRWLEDGDWGKAFMRVIPKRKDAKLKNLLANNGVVECGEEIGNEDASASPGQA